MPRAFSVFTIGLSQAQETEFLELVSGESSFLKQENISFSSLEDVFTLGDEANLVIFNTTNLDIKKIGLEKFVSNLKSQVPTVKILMIDQENSYDLLLAGMRAGVSDVISYPFNGSIVCKQIEKALLGPNYFANMLSMFDLFSDPVGLQNDEKLFKTIDDFLGRTIQNGPLIVCKRSVSADMSKGQDSIYWASLKAQATLLDALEMNKYEEAIERFNLKEQTHQLTPFSSVQTHDGDFGVIQLGCNEETEYFMMFKSLDAFSQEQIRCFLSPLARLVHNSFQQMAHFKIQRHLSSMANTDDVTGLYNQRKLKHDLDRLLVRFDKYQEPFSVLFLDIDYFKKINDGHGHMIGSAILHQLARELRKILRDTDQLYRYGGDEFVALLPTCDRSAAKQVALRVLDAVKKKIFIPAPDLSIHIGLSIGVASVPDDALSVKEIVEMADQMMYKAKNNGRGQVCMAGQLFHV